MNEIKIKKVKLIKSGEKLEVAYQETGDIKSDVDKTCENPCHLDLKNAVAGLAVHLALLTDYINIKRAGDKEEIDKFVVTGYSIGGKEDEEGIVITGYRKTPSGKTVTLNTPFLRLEQDDDGYFLISDLTSKIDSIKQEVFLYLDGKKDLTGAQTAMEFPDGEQVTKMQIDHPDAEHASDVIHMNGSEKNKGTKKVQQTADNPSGDLIEEAF